MDDTKEPNNPADVPTQRRTSSAYGLCYAIALPALRDVARSHGYALTVHGSMATDLDLVACPWVDEASEPDALAIALKKCIGGVFGAAGPGYVRRRPHGRTCYIIIPDHFDNKAPTLDHRPYIDLSVMPKLLEK